MVLPEPIQGVTGNAVLDLLRALGLGQVNTRDEVLPHPLLLRKNLVQGEIMPGAGAFPTDNLLKFALIPGDFPAAALHFSIHIAEVFFNLLVRAGGIPFCSVERTHSPRTHGHELVTLNHRIGVREPPRIGKL